MRPVDRAEVDDAATRLDGVVRRTPILDVEVAGRSVALKLDLLQPTGSFKVRGATSLLASRDPDPAGVVAASGGNFGLAVAWAAQRLGVTAHVFVPGSSPREKIEPIRALGAQVHVIEGYYHEALQAARDHLARSGGAWAHAYDQRPVVAGQGTAARELLADRDLGTVLVACGGGGLLAGIAGYVGDGTRVVAVETEGTPALHAARRAGRPVDVEVSGVAASSLGARQIGELAWAAQDWVDDALLVSDDEVVAAQRWLWTQARLVAEPGGATALAALLAGRYRPAVGERIGVLVCGANTDPASVVAAP